MTVRDSRVPWNGQEDVETEATVTSIAIAGLRRRLQRLRMPDDPMLLPELRKLGDVLTALYEQVTPSTGRHRASRAPDLRDGQQADEPGSQDLKPDPALAGTAQELIDVLVLYKVWSGDLPWRVIAARAGQKRVASTICEAMKRSVLPTREVVEVIIIGCGGSMDDLDAFIAAWQRISASGATGQAEEPDLLAAPVLCRTCR